MLFWIVAALMTAAVLVVVLVPLLKPRAGATGRAAYDLEVYRDQLAELDRERERGVITEAQAGAARAEIGRRMIAAADRSGTEVASVTPRRARALAAVLAVGLPLAALAVYVPLGRPDLPAQPFATRDLAAEQGDTPSASVMAAVDALKAKLEANPDDLQGWVLLGQFYGRTERWAEAADAFRRAVHLSSGDLDLTATYAEVLVNANGGTVPEEARVAFDAVLEQNAKDPRARFYLGLARFQAGDAQGALDHWRALAADTPADAPWLPAVRARIAEAAGQLGLDAAAVTPEPQPPAQPPAAQDDAIRGMVESLAAKMEANPDNVEGWIQLARSWRVLGDIDKAETAARAAVARAPERADALMALADVQLARATSDGAAPMPADAVATLDRVLALDPQNRNALWLRGIAANNAGRREEAVALWTRLLGLLDPKDPDHALVRKRIETAKAGG